MTPSNSRRRRKSKPLHKKVQEYFKNGSDRQWYLVVVLSSCLVAGAMIYLFESSMPALI